MARCNSRSRVRFSLKVERGDASRARGPPVSLLRFPLCVIALPLSEPFSRCPCSAAIRWSVRLESVTPLELPESDDRVILTPLDRERELVPRIVVSGIALRFLVAVDDRCTVVDCCLRKSDDTLDRSLDSEERLSLEGMIVDRERDSVRAESDDVELRFERVIDGVGAWDRD